MNLPSRYVAIAIGDVHVQAFIDSGADCSMIREDVFSKLPSNFRANIKKTTKRLAAITGDVMDVKGCVNLKLDVIHSHRVQTNQKFQIVSQDSATKPLILGIDWLLANGVSLHFAEGEIVVHGKRIPLLDKNQVTPHDHNTIALTSSVTIPPHTQMMITARIQDPQELHSTPMFIKPEYTGVFYPNDKFSGTETDIHILAAAVMTNSQNEIPISIVNYSDQECSLDSNTNVGMLDPISESDYNYYDIQDLVSDMSDCELDIDSESSSTSFIQCTGSAAGNVPPPVDLSKSALTSEQRHCVNKLLAEYSDIFSTPDRPYGRTDWVKLSIDVGNSRPIKQRAFRISPTMQKELDSQIQNLLKHDIIRPSQSPYSSPLLLVKKKNKGEYRLVIDYRKVNQQIVKSALPIPILEQCLDTLGGNSLFSTIDFASGYFQVELDEDSKYITAFTTGSELFEFNVLPQGLSISPGQFQFLIQSVFKGMTKDQAVVYLDDVCFYSQTFQTHLEILSQAFQRIRDANLTLRPDKCHFFMHELKFLGHIVNEKGIAPDPGNLEKVASWPRPTNVKEVRGFVSLCSYYRRMVKDFAHIAFPLHNLTKKDVPFIWTPECESAFLALRERLISSPIVAYPDFDKPFVLTTDASAQAIGAVLSQEHDGIERVVAYYSAALTPTAQRYGAYDREFLAIVSAIRKFKHYLMGTSFTIVTDHKPLVDLRTSSYEKVRDPHNRRARWMTEIDPLNWTIQYKPGVKNMNADQMSRHPDSLRDAQQALEVEREIGVSQIVTDSTSNDDTNTQDISDQNFIGPHPTAPPKSFHEYIQNHCLDILNGQQLDIGINTVRQYLQNGAFPQVVPSDPWLKALVKDFEQLYVDETDDLVYRTSKQGIKQVLIPKAWVPCMIEQFHGAPLVGHTAPGAAYKKAMQVCFWPGMKSDIENRVRTCAQCQKFSNPNPPYKAPLHPIKPDHPMQIVSMDIAKLPLSTLGNQYVVTVTDLFTKHVKLFATPNQTAVTVAKCFFNDYILTFGIPEALITDQGGQFQSELFQELCKLFGVDKRRSTPYMPSVNGGAERTNRTFKTQLARRLDEYSNKWDLELSKVEFAYNTSIHSSTKFTPYFLQFGREPLLPVQLLLGQTQYTEKSHDYVKSLSRGLIHAHAQANTNLAHARELQARYHDRSARFRRYKKGDRVYYRNPTQRTKLEPTWLGPFTICDDSQNGLSYKIVNMNDPLARPAQVVHHDKLKPCVEIGTPKTPSGYMPPEVQVHYARPTHPGSAVVPPTPPRPPDINDATIIVTANNNQNDPPSPEVSPPSSIISETPPNSPGGYSTSSLNTNDRESDEDDFTFFPFPDSDDSSDLPPTRSGRKRHRPEILKDFVTF